MIRSGVRVRGMRIASGWVIPYVDRAGGEQDAAAAAPPHGGRDQVPRRHSSRAEESAVPWTPALAVAGLAILVFGMLAGTHPVAGDSAVLLDKHLWLDGLPTAANPVWGLMVRLLARLVPAAPVAVLNWFSVLGGAGAAALFYWLSARLLELVYPGRRPQVYVFSGVSAALCLVVSPPFWIVSSRAHPLSFDALLLLLALFLQTEYQRTRRIGFLHAFSFVYGVGLIEYPVFAVLAWPLAVLTLLLMRKRGHLRRSRRRKNLGLSAAWGAIGVLAAAVPACWALTHSPARLWMEDASWLAMLRLMPAAGWKQFSGGFPRTGWVLIGLVTVVPWAVCLVETRRRASLRHLPSASLYLVLTGLALVVLFNGPFAPFVLLQEGAPAVLPYFFTASTFGFLVNYWRAAFQRLWEKGGWRAGWLRDGLIALLPAGLFAAPLGVLPAVAPHSTRVLYDCAGETLEAMGERTWLVTDGSLDSLLRLAAYEQGRELEVFSLPDGFDPRYRRMLAARFADARYRSLASVGLLPLLRELLRKEPAMVDRLAFQNSGALWLEAGYDPVPERLVYGGRRPDAPPPDAAGVLDRHRGFWQRMVGRLWLLEQSGSAQGLLARHLRWQISRVANDLGVMLERGGEEAAAREAYRAARTANDLNASAIVNLAEAGERADEAPALRGELQLPLPMLVARHGHIHRLSNLLTARGDDDAGAPAMPVSIREQFREVAARYQAGDGPGSLEALAAILREDPGNPLAWYLRGLLGAQFGDEAAWQESWQFMERQPRPWPAFLLVAGERLLRAGQTSDGLALYERAFALGPYEPRIVRPVAMAEFSLGTHRHAEPYIVRLLSLDPGDPWGNFALGTIQFQRGEYALAESSLRVAADRLNLPSAHNNLAWVLALNGKYAEARQQVRAALDLDREFAPAWDTLGVILMREGDLERAATALARALELNPDSWDTRVHYAQLALAAGRDAEAAEAARALERESRAKSPDELADYRALRRQLGLPATVAFE